MTVDELYNLKLLTAFDIRPYAGYCEAYSRWRTANEQIRAAAEQGAAFGGLVIETAKGGWTQNPLVRIARDAALEMLRFASEFGFTPAARSRISTIEAQRTAGKFDGLLAG